MTLQPNDVHLVHSPAGDYGGSAGSFALENSDRSPATPVLTSLRRLLESAGFDAANSVSDSWNPLGEIIREGDRVLIKPNWVTHENAAGSGQECLITHTAVLEAILHYVALSRPRSVVIGDAPIQGCDFDALTRNAGLPELRERFANRGMAIDIRDFRLIRLDGRGRGSLSLPTGRTIEDYVLFDLGYASRLEPISSGSPQFRVTMYDPDVLAAAHRLGRHRYLVAREAIEADVVINVPKLKTHKKACITGALKNVIGINGHKSYLPHHRKGGAGNGGDCYPGRSFVKSAIESLLDRANHSAGSATRRCYAVLAAGVGRVEALRSAPVDLEGSWYGNDTIWRTTLDLQRILYYGCSDGTIGATPQRRILHITDGLVAGQGEGPLAPAPLALGVLTMGTSAAAVDWVNALLLGLDPAKIPLTSAAFDDSLPDRTGFGPDEIRVFAGGPCLSPAEAARKYGATARPPSGWIGHCEWEPAAETVCF
jgi:uncharacterized protein (DUF362 family)